MKQLKDRVKSVYAPFKTIRCLLAGDCPANELIPFARAYLAGRLFHEQSDEKHLKAAMRWLCDAQDSCGGEGVSALYDLKTGWGVPYPETSGYIVATYLAYADFAQDATFIERAIRIGDWEIAIQHPNGGVLSNPTVEYTRVFNTGQVILGWCCLYEMTNNIKYLSASLRAGDYLKSKQETDGTWRYDTYCGPRTYHARIDWALLRLAQLSGEQRFADCAHKNLKWVLSQQKGNGWFSQCGFNGEWPITHVIVYTLRGLLESYVLDGTSSSHAELDILPAVIKAAEAFAKVLERHAIRGIQGMIPASFDEKWESTDNHSCLTGNSQLACFLFRLAHVTKEEKYKKTAEFALQATKMTQILETSFDAVKGGIPGTYPMFQGYCRNAYPNWATKFFADALMMKMQFAHKLAILA
jgi:hypothetical protein